MRLPSLDEHALLTMWAQLLIVVAAARMLGGAMRRVGQPPVVGELLAGVLLGPSVLARLWPDAGHLLVPQDALAAAPINAIGWLGVAFLLVLTGFETDLKIVRKLGRPATSVAIGGLALPFVVGLATGLVMPSSFRGDHGTTTAFVLFIAVSLSISSLPVIAKILDELGFMRRNFGQVTIAVGMVNDLIGWLALGVIAALGRSSHLTVSSVLVPIIAIAAILFAAFTVGQRGVDAVLRQVRRREGSGVDAMTVTVVLTLLLAVLTQVARSDAVLGAYIAGILIGRSRFFQRRIATQLESVTMAVFAPVFFATAGLRIDLAALGHSTALAWAGIVLVIAIASKLVGAFGGARVASLSAREGLALAIGLNCRGAVEVVIATVGLTIGVLSSTAYTAIVLMAIVTSVMAPPLLRLVVRDWPGGAEERERLEREEAMERNLLVRASRLLLPSRGGRSSEAVARVLHAGWPDDVAVTVMSVDDDQGHEPDLPNVIAAFGERIVERRHVEGNPLEEVLDEAKLGYGALGLGARDSFTEGGAVLSPVGDALLGRSPLPMVIVRGGRGDRDHPERFRRALVPVAGTPASRTAQELAYNLARSMGTEVVLTHVVSRPVPEPYPDGEQAMARTHARVAASSEVASSVLEQARALAAEHSVDVRGTVRDGTATAEEVLAEAESADADVIVLGTTIRRLRGRAFLGHTVEHILDHADATVVVVATPDTLHAAGIADRDAGADNE
jgi:Kef-type K+ transport system membrane component KefB